MNPHFKYTHYPVVRGSKSLTIRGETDGHTVGKLIDTQVGNAKKKNIAKKNCPEWDSNPRRSGLQPDYLNHSATEAEVFVQYSLHSNDASM